MGTFQEELAAAMDEAKQAMERRARSQEMHAEQIRQMQLEQAERVRKEQEESADKIVAFIPTAVKYASGKECKIRCPYVRTWDDGFEIPSEFASPDKWDKVPDRVFQLVVSKCKELGVPLTIFLRGYETQNPNSESPSCTYTRYDHYLAVAIG